MTEPADATRWHRLHQLLDECLDLSAEVRAARLADVAREEARRADAEASRAANEAARAEYEATQAKAQAARTRKVKEFLVSIFVQADPMRRTGSGPVSVQDAFDAALERARNDLSSDPVLQADILDDFGEIRANQGRFDEAQALFEQAATVAEAEYGPTHPVLAESLANLGVVRQFRGDALAAAPYLERAVAILENDDGGDPLALANTAIAITAASSRATVSSAMALPASTARPAATSAAIRSWVHWPTMAAARSRICHREAAH